MSTSPTATRTVALPSAPVFVGAAYAVSVLGMIALAVGEIAFTDNDIHGSDGPIEAIVYIGIFGTAALVIGVGIGLLLVRTPERAKVGAILLAALAVVSGVVFWTGAPAVLGACAAWLAGLTRGGRPLGGVARAAGVVGVFIVLLNVVMSLIDYLA